MRLRRDRTTPSPWAFFVDFRRIVPYLWPHRWLAGGSLGLVGFGVVTALLAPWPLAIVIDSVLGDRPLPDVLSRLDGLGTYQLLAVAVAAGLLITGIEHGVAVLDNYVNTRWSRNRALKSATTTPTFIIKHTHQGLQYRPAGLPKVIVRIQASQWINCMPGPDDDGVAGWCGDREDLNWDRVATPPVLDHRPAAHRNRAMLSPVQRRRRHEPARGRV